MNILDLLTTKDYISLVKKFIEKVFVHEAARFGCNEEDLSIILTRTKNKDIQILTYSNSDNIVLRTIPDKEAQDILMK